MKTSFDFDKPIADLQSQVEKVKQVAEKTKVDMSATLKELDAKIEKAKLDIYSNLNGWQQVQISRHPERPYTLQYIELICDDFIEMHGDRTVKDDKAIVGGFGTLNGQTVMFIGHQKGINAGLYYIHSHNEIHYSRNYFSFGKCQGIPSTSRWTIS